MDGSEGELYEPPGDDASKKLRRAKWVVGLWLVAASTASLVATLWLVDDLWSGTATAGQGEGADLPRLLVLAALAGATGSSGAALRSFIDRTGNGYEFDTADQRRAQWPELRKKKDRFNLNMVPGLVLRPLLGGILAPIAYATIVVTSEFVVGGGVDTSTDRQVLVVLFIAGLFGMFAKSVWENLNERAKHIFKSPGPSASQKEGDGVTDRPGSG